MITPFAVLIVSRVEGRQRSQAARNTRAAAGSEWGSFEVSYSCFIYLAFSWLAKANLGAFSWSLANLFSYLDTFFRGGLMNLPFMSLTEMVSSLIWRSRRMTSRCRKNISPSRLYHLSKYCWQIFFRSSMEAESRSALVPHLSAITLSLSSAFLSCSFFSSSAAFFLSRVLSFFFLSGVMNPFFLAMVTVSCYRFWMEMRASRSFRGTACLLCWAARADLGKGDNSPVTGAPPAPGCAL